MEGGGGEGGALYQFFIRRGKAARARPAARPRDALPLSPPARSLLQLRFVLRLDAAPGGARGAAPAPRADLRSKAELGNVEASVMSKYGEAEVRGFRVWFMVAAWGLGSRRRARLAGACAVRRGACAARGNAPAHVCSAPQGDEGEEDEE